MSTTTTEAAKPAPTLPTVTARRTAFHAVMARAMAVVKVIDAAARTGDAASAQRGHEALLEAERVLRRATR